MSPSREERIADYCTGQMSTAEAERFEREMTGDAELAQAVASGLERFSALDATARPLTPRPELWRAIEAKLGAPSKRQAQASRSAPSLWQSLAFWRWAGLSGLAASAALAVGLVASVLQPPPPPQFVAILVPADNTAPGAVVEIGAGGEARLITLQDIPVPPGRALQVWTLPSRERGPVSVGLLGAARSAGLDLQTLPPTRADQLFEITLEPAAGSPTGRPTGPVLFKGLAVQAL